MKADDKLYFLDGVHPQHNSMPAYGWLEKEKTREIRSNSGRQRLNLNGALNLKDYEVVIREDDSINAQSTLKQKRFTAFSTMLVTTKLKSSKSI